MDTKHIAPLILFRLNVADDYCYGAQCDEYQRTLSNQTCAIRGKGLILKHCNITQIPENAFHCLHQLRFLDLSQNRITRLAARVFHPLEGLRSLYLVGRYHCSVMCLSQSPSFCLCLSVCLSVCLPACLFYSVLS